jgi:hypothetical protein
MNDFLGRLAARSLGSIPSVRPRPASFFEPARPVDGFPAEGRTLMELESKAETPAAGPPFKPVPLSADSGGAAMPPPSPPARPGDPVRPASTPPMADQASGVIDGKEAAVLKDSGKHRPARHRMESDPHAVPIEEGDRKSESPERKTGQGWNAADGAVKNHPSLPQSEPVLRSVSRGSPAAVAPVVPANPDAPVPDGTGVESLARKKIPPSPGAQGAGTPHTGPQDMESATRQNAGRLLTEGLIAGQSDSTKSAAETVGASKPSDRRPNPPIVRLARPGSSGESRPPELSGPAADMQRFLARLTAGSAGRTSAAPQAPPVRVTIGRIEVRAVAPPAEQPPRRASAKPREATNLDEYLEQRNKQR